MFGPGEADPVLASVEDAVVLRQKYISQNPQGAFRGNDVYGLKTAKTQLPATEDLLTDRGRENRPSINRNSYFGERLTWNSTPYFENVVKNTAGWIIIVLNLSGQIKPFKQAGIKVKVIVQIFCAVQRF